MMKAKTMSFVAVVLASLAMCSGGMLTFALNEGQASGGKQRSPALKESGLFLVDLLTGYQPARIPLNRPAGTFSPTGRDGRDEGERLKESSASGEPLMQARKDPATGRWDLSEAGKLVLGYNYQTNDPGDLLSKVSQGNRQYARARSDYIHPLCGLDGEILTQDWSVDHPHHRGIYWAWPEVDYRGQRGDLHALQLVFARPTGQCTGESGPVFARIDAEDLWLWEDREPIVRERALIRAWRSNEVGRCIDLEFHFTALKDDVSIARRGAQHYGGLNIRVAPVKEQQIVFYTDPPDANPLRAWAELSGTFANGRGPTGISVFQHPDNPHYPGDWIKYPELNWFQPTFPASGTRYVLKKDQKLVLQFRIWIHRGSVTEAQQADQWSAYVHPPRFGVNSN